MSDTVKKYKIQQKIEGGYLTLHPETSADLVLDTTSKVMMTSDERKKLAGITNEATFNKIDAIKVGADGTAVPIDNKTAILPKYDEGAQVNVIESIALGGTGTEVTVSEKVATLPVATGAQVNKIEIVKLGENAVTISESDKSVTLPMYEANAQVNKIEVIKINGEAQTITDKAVNLPAYDAGAQVNVIEKVKYAGAELTPDSNKTVEITVDTTVSSSSKSAVSSSAVYTALSNKVDKDGDSSLMTSAEHTKLAGIAENANVNVIEIVKVNGTALKPDSDKAVDVKVPTTVAELTDKTDYLTVSTAADTYATKEQLTNLIGNAPAALDTLGEIAAWIGNDTTGASAMLADITGLKNEVYGTGQDASAEKSRIDAIETKVNGMATDGTVQDIQRRVTALEGSVGTTDTTGLRKAVKENTTNITAHDTRISANTTAIGEISSITPGSWTGDYLTYTQFTSDGGSGLLKTVKDQSAWIDVLKDVVFDESAGIYTNLVQKNTNSIAANATKLSVLTTELFGKDDTTGDSRIDTAESDISTVISEVWGASTTTGDSRIDRLESSIGTTDTAEGTLRSRITALETTVNHSTDGVKANAAAIDTLQGYFTKGIANNADKLDNHDSTYFATAEDLNTVKGYFTDGKAKTAANADSAAATTKLSSAKTISMTGDVAWSVSFDGSDNVTAAGTLATTGVTAGTYTAVTVDAKGRVTNGAASIEVGTTVDGDASGNLAVGGLFFRLIEE